MSKIINCPNMKMHLLKSVLGCPLDMSKFYSYPYHMKLTWIWHHVHSWAVQISVYLPLKCLFHIWIIQMTLNILVLYLCFSIYSRVGFGHSYSDDNFYWCDFLFRFWLFVTPTLTHLYPVFVWVLSNIYIGRHIDAVQIHLFCIFIWCPCPNTFSDDVS